MSSLIGIDPIASLDVLEHLNYYACNLTSKISYKEEVFDLDGDILWYLVGKK